MKRQLTFGVPGIPMAGLLIFLILFSLPFTAMAGNQQVAIHLQGAEVVPVWDPSDGASGEIVLMNNVYEPLLRYDAINNTFKLVLAAKVEQSEDAKTWTFTLRKGVKFHTGNEMDAAAVKFCVERTIERGKGSAYIWGSVKTVEVLDKYTVRFNLKVPAPLDLIAASGYCSYIFDPKFSDHDWFNTGKDSGTGPYMVESFDGREKVIVKKFDDYWGGWEGKHFERVVFLSISEASTKRMMLETGKADFIEQLPPTDVEALRSNPAVRIEQNPSFQNLMILYNNQRKPLNNALVRRALSYLIPYEDTVKVALGGYGTVSRGVIPRGLWGHSDQVETFSYNPVVAKALLTQAGYPDGGLKLVTTYPAGYDDIRKTVELWKAACAELNIEIDARAMPTAERNAIARSPDPDKRQDIYILYWWPDYSNPDSFLSGAFYTQEKPAYNLGYYSNKDFDALVDYTVTLPAGSPGAIGMVVELQNMLQRDAAGVAVWDMQYLRIMAASLKGYVDNPAYPNVVFWYDCYRE
jgi:peptide/nickel transport system substrate-binding protein